MSLMTFLKRIPLFCKDKDGSMSIEFVLWFPFFLALQGLIADSSLAFLNVNRMYDAARDTARRAAIGDLTSAQAVNFATNSLPDFIAPTITVDDSHATDLVINITAPIANLSFFGYFDGLSLGNINISHTVRKEVS